jgi:DNA-binding response OmpR family regulator
MALDTFHSALPQAMVHRILIVDDEESVVESLTAILEGAGYDVVVARDGGQAHSAFTMRNPDFVLCDLKLAGNETGFEICERFKQANRRIPVVILTAIDLPRARRLAERVGADGFLIKPIEGDRLLAQVREIADAVWRRSLSEEFTQTSPQSIRFACRCGKRFKVSEQHRGKTLTCPSCGEPVIVPRHA